MSKKSFTFLWPVSFLSCLSWLSVHLFFTASLLSTEIKTTQGMQVTSTGPQTIQKAEGEEVTLGCRYTPSPLNRGELDIEWSVVSPDPTQKDQMLISYTSGAKYIHGDDNFAKGLRFSANDPSLGDASLSIALLTPAHSATYQCKVRKTPGVDMLKVSLVVMAKPSVPKCWVEGGELIGGPVSLHCNSATGSTPLKYSWRREFGGPIPAAATQNSATGELRISNHSLSFAGIYLCEANNAVGAEHCRINLKASKPPNRAAVIVGTVVGSVLLIFILLVFIVLLFWKLSSRHRYEKEFSNEIREDVPAPESRPVSRHTSRSTSRHPQVSYCQVGESEGNSFSDSSTHTPSGDSSGHTPVKYTSVRYDSQYGYAV
ncbi:V-set and immunoglobulin domain-containing protein 8a [Halichoeres trimaculatus]|uniref:V-set and immunoglobulin domain-containing protein 8a n=1 Tax=Halichoeres trimaculatus TaxID=147232 RepID=UPI003D9F4213